MSQLLGGAESDSSFATTSDEEEEIKPDFSRVGIEGANPETDLSQEELLQVWWAHVWHRRTNAWPQGGWSGGWCHS